MFSTRIRLSVVLSAVTSMRYGFGYTLHLCAHAGQAR